MNVIRRAGRAAAAVAVVICFSATARAEGVLDQVPAEAWVVIRVNRLEETNKKVTAWAEAMGLAQMSPEAADPLGAIERESNIKGLDRSRDMAIVLMDPSANEGNPEKSVLILLPTNDYKALAASLPNLKTAGAVTTFNASEDGADEEEKGFVANWGTYAALSPTQALVSKKPGAGLKLTGVSAKEMQEKDAVFYANIPAMRATLLPKLKKAREDARKAMQQQLGGADGAADATATPPAATARPGAAPAARPQQRPAPAQRPGGAGTTPPPAGRRQGTGQGKAQEPQVNAVEGGAAVTTLASFQEQPAQQPARRPAAPARPAPGADAEEDADSQPANASARGAAPAGGDPAEAMKAYVPAIQAVVDQYFNVAERFLTDANAATFSINLTDEGLNTTLMAEFAQGSYLGKIASGFKNTDGALTAGLPGGRKYFGFGGMNVSSEVWDQFITDMIDPVVQKLAGTGAGGQNVTQMVQAMKVAMKNTKTTAFGYPAPTGALGTESIVQSIVVSTGNAKAIADSQKTMLKSMNSLMQSIQGQAGAAAGQQPVQMDFQIQEGAKTVGGVKLDQYKVDMQMDADNNPQAAQAQQMMAMVYGPNGLSGVMGPVNDKTFVLVQGGTDQTVEAAVKAAQGAQDLLGPTGPVKAVAGQLPKNRFGVFYLQLDQLVTSGVRYAQGFGMPLKMQLPQNLPPLGFTAASEGTALRFDTHVPTSTIQSIVAAGMQTYMQMQGGGAEGAPEGL